MIFVEFFKQFDFFKKIKKFRFQSNFRKMLIYVKFSKQFDFDEILEKFRFCTKFSKNLEFFENFGNFSFWPNFRKMSILVKIFDFFLKFAIFWFSQTFEKFVLGKKF